MELAGKTVYSVWEITRHVKDLLESQFAHVYVEGEISGLTRAASGHVYFDIKDDRARLSCVMWRNTARSLRFDPETGMQVVCRGRITVYEPRGAYQLVLDTMVPKGVGALQQAFEQLKARLAGEGLFDAGHKIALPEVPSRVGVVTSPSGAAVRDVIRVAGDRWDNLPIVVLPCRVQGEGAAAGIADMIATANRHRVCDVLIVGRGGGSLEDLWAFNEEVVARAIFDSKIPVVSAVGHEIDFTIADFVADVRAATPSAAAEIVVPKKSDLKRRLWERTEEASLRAQAIVERKRTRLERTHARLRDPRSRLENQAMRLDELDARLRRALRSRLSETSRRTRVAFAGLRSRSPLFRLRETRGRAASLHRAMRVRMRSILESNASRLRAAAGTLNALSPDAVLARGYAIVQRGDTGAVVSNAKEAGRGDELRIRLHRGELDAVVRGRRNDKKRN